MFLIMYSKYSFISDTEYDPSGKSNSPFQVGADTLNLLLLHENLMFFHM